MKHGTLHFEKLSRFPRPAEPCSVAVPLAPGVLIDPAAFAVADAGRLLPTQSAATARWPDGSVKWLYAEFLADLPANAACTLEWKTGCVPPPPSTPLQIEGDGAAMRLDTGAACLTLQGAGALFGELTCGPLTLPAGAIRVPVIVDADGRRLAPRPGSEGWRIVRSGPVGAILELEGSHAEGEGPDALDFRLRVQAFAGQPWFRVDYRLIHRAAVAAWRLRSIGWTFRPPSGGLPARLALGRSNYATHVARSDDGTPLDFMIGAEHLVYEANEQVPETLYGTFWADWADPDCGGLCVTLYQAFQNFPKALRAHAQGLDVDLYPAEGVVPIVLRQGVARTQRWLLHPHGPDADLGGLDARSLQFQMPDRPVLEPEAYREAGVFEPVGPASKVPGVEAFLLDAADERARAYGMLHWGDGPDMGYTHQGRGGGALVWTNNEYDLPHVTMLQFVRTGERRFLDYLLVAAEHQMDVDVCHHSDDPLRRGGQIMHSAGHVSRHVVPSHEWVEGLLDLYHQTADATAFETAVGIGENVLRHLELPAMREAAGTSARETGWALRTLVALYQETGEARWMEPAEGIVDQFAAWHATYGAWVAPYTSHTLARVPFMIAIAGCSLMRYYRLTRDERTSGLIVAAGRDLLEHALRPDGRFYYKELPSLQRRGAGSYVLELLAYAFDITGDPSFLDAGMPTLRELLAGGGRSGGGGKQAVDDEAGPAVVVGGASPKHIASMFLPVAMFARALADAGHIDTHSGR